MIPTSKRKKQCKICENFFDIDKGRIVLNDDGSDGYVCGRCYNYLVYGLSTGNGNGDAYVSS